MSHSQIHVAGSLCAIVKRDCVGRERTGPEKAALRPKRVPGITVSRTWSEVKRKRVWRWYEKEVGWSEFAIAMCAGQ
jgi:hypothetical protein